VPAIDKRAGAEPTWADTLDTLRVPRRPDQKPWDWRRDAPIRPVVFADPGTLDDDVVHLHLEHRVVKRLLNRFVAQGFVHDELSRACVGQTRDTIPRVLLLGRLSLFGPGAARLHDEVIAIATRWTDPDTRRQSLRPFASDAQDKALGLLEETLADERLHNLPDEVSRRLRAAIARDVSELRPHLEERGHELARRARERLFARAEKESKEMHDILTQQRDSILRTRKATAQLTLDLEDERRQLEADRRHWERRLTQLERELETEPARIRDSYDVRVARVAPVGVAYLWPVSG
jgi:hypothetical protein